MKEKIAFIVIAIALLMLTACADNHEKSDGLPGNQDNRIILDTPADPHVPSITVPRVRIILEQAVSGPKVYVPHEIMIGSEALVIDDLLLQEMRNDLPVITFYPSKSFYIWVEMVSDETLEYTTYTTYDESFEEVYSGELIRMPPQPGDFTLLINASWVEDNSETYDAVYLIRIVRDESREQCKSVDWYHGGGNGLFLQEGFHELLELYALLEQDNKTVEEYLKALCDPHREQECPCHLQTKADVQNFFSWFRLNELRLPFSNSAILREIHIRDRYSDVYARYIFDDMLYDFTVMIPEYSLTVEESLAGWIVPGSKPYEFLTSVGDVNIYITNKPDDPRAVFILSVNGAYVQVVVSIPCANPEKCDRGTPIPGTPEHYCDGEQVNKQSAVDGLLQFEFKTLI